MTTLRHLVIAAEAGVVAVQDTQHQPPIEQRLDALEARVSDLVAQIREALGDAPGLELVIDLEDRPGPSGGTSPPGRLLLLDELLDKRRELVDRALEPIDTAL